MGRKPKNTEDAFTYDLRAKVNKRLHDEVDSEAAERMVDKSQIVREVVMQYLERKRKSRGKKED